MKYKKIQKGTPTAGEIVDANIQEVSLVDNPANGVKLLLKKNYQESEMNEEMKKRLIELGLSESEIEKIAKNFKGELEQKVIKAVDALTDLDQFSESKESNEVVKKSILSTIKKAFGFEKSNDSGTKIDVLETKLDSLTKSFTEFITKTLTKTNENTDSGNSEVEALRKQNEELKTKIENEENLQKNSSSANKELDELKKQNEELQKKLEIVTKARTGGNSLKSEGKEQQQVSEEAKKQAIWNGSPFDIKA